MWQISFLAILVTADVSWYKVCWGLERSFGEGVSVWCRHGCCFLWGHFQIQELELLKVNPRYGRGREAVLLPADIPALKNKVKKYPSAIHMKKERGMSGVLKGLHNVGSFVSSFPPVPASPGAERRPSGSRKSSSRVSSRQFWELQPWASRDASGNSRCHSKDGKELVQWPGAPQRQGAKAWSGAVGLGKLPETQGPGDLCPAQICTTLSCLGSWGREKEFATQEIPVVTAGI